MDAKELISQSDLQSFYQQQQQQHRAFGGHHSPSSLAGMHSVIRPMPNMNMSPTAILNSISGGSLAGMQFQMDPPPPLLHNINATGAVTPAPAEPLKRKRGRPRKYGPDGTMRQQQQQQAASSQQQLVATQPRICSLSSGPDMLGSSGMEDPAQKKRRGRPPGTGKKHQPSTSQGPGNAFAGSAGTSFTPHIITASPSEDVAAKIVAFASQSSKAVCVLSAMGSVSRAVLRHPADGSPMARVHASPQPYKNPAVYEGFYEILSLTGSYNLAQGGGLSVTLCSPERNVIGGVLGGPLVAAGTVQVVLGSFHQGGSRSKSKKAGKQQQAAAFSPDSLTGGQEASPSSGHNQNLTPPPSVTGGWPTSGIFDTRSSSIDINSSRG
ncbi:uncharacterized protein LOC100194172 [Zea mays]|nr:uncharacterized protein LOC100194172 [Zea mays]ONM11942.1 AT-hook motif nuclear-localized protein 5 [Zea mays]|eukprot:NP_001132694.2 uncharacterized protein LOC100194172 [Zea mays]